MTATSERLLTFFVWSDTHFGYEQRPPEDDLRGRIIDQMNSLPGREYPLAVGGTVGEPEFVILCGDTVDGEGPGEDELAVFQRFSARLRWPQIEVMGNHDIDPAFTQYFVGAYGGLSHSFDRQGVHFVCLDARYDVADVGRFDQEHLDFLEADLSSAGDAPVVLFVHSRLDRMKNGRLALDILHGRHVVLIMSAHIHRPAVFQLDGFDCVDTGQCRDHPIDAPFGRCLHVVRISSSRLTAVPWRWDLADWERGQRWQDPDDVAARSTLDKTY